MKKKIVARGRNILGSDSSDFIRSLETKEAEKVFTLKSGNQAKFTLSTILNGDIEEKTFVDPAVNGRDQRYVTPESVSDITRTINLQQFFPAIGRVINGCIEVLDGSARRHVSSVARNSKFWLQKMR